MNPKRSLVQARLDDGIDRNSYEPAYAQLRNVLREKIIRGEFRSHDKLPSEAELCKKYGLSPMTIRRAINLLVDEGLVRTVQGKGTFVAPLDLGQATFHFRDFRDNLRGTDRHFRAKLIDAKVLPASEKTARKLHIPKGQKVLFIRRLIFQEDEPVVYDQKSLIYDPTKPIVEAELETTSLDELLYRQGEVSPNRAELTIEAITLKDEEAQLLRVSPGSPAFRVAQLVYDVHDRPVGLGSLICRGDKYKFTASIRSHSLK